MAIYCECDPRWLTRWPQGGPMMVQLGPRWLRDGRNALKMPQDSPPVRSQMASRWPQSVQCRRRWRQHGSRVGNRHSTTAQHDLKKAISTMAYPRPKVAPIGMQSRVGSLYAFVRRLLSFRDPRSGKMGQDESKTAQDVASVTRGGSQDGPKAAP